MKMEGFCPFCNQIIPNKVLAKNLRDQGLPSLAKLVEKI